MTIEGAFSQLIVKTNSNPKFDMALKYLVMPDARIREIRQHTNDDLALQLLKQTIQEGWPDHHSALPPLVVPYLSIRDELAVTDGLVFRGERLVIPKSLRSQIKKDTHSGHQGIESCLRRAREHVFWPGMNKEVKEWIQTCEACREFEQTPCKETLISHEIPDSPWQKIAQRLFGRRTRNLLPTTQSLLKPRNLVNPESVHLRSNQERQAKYYNRTARDLPILKPGDTVRMKPFALGQKAWDKAHVTKRLDERSYEVQSAGTTFRRNRQHLVETRQPTQFEQSVRDQATPNEIHDQQTSSNTRTSVAQTRPKANST